MYPASGREDFEANNARRPGSICGQFAVYAFLFFIFFVFFKSSFVFFDSSLFE